MQSSLKPNITMHLDDQCRWSFKTRAGNQMLLTFVSLKHDRSVWDRWDDTYEFLNLTTEKRHLLSCRDLNKYFDSGHFYDLKKTSIYKEHELSLAQDSLIKLIIHVN